MTLYMYSKTPKLMIFLRGLSFLFNSILVEIRLNLCFLLYQMRNGYWCMLVLSVVGGVWEQVAANLVHFVQLRWLGSVVLLALWDYRGINTCSWGGWECCAVGLIHAAEESVIAHFCKWFQTKNIKMFVLEKNQQSINLSNSNRIDHDIFWL